MKPWLTILILVAMPISANPMPAQQTCSSTESLRKNLAASVDDPIAQEALFECGKEAIPYLVSIFRNREEAWPVRYASLVALSTRDEFTNVVYLLTETINSEDDRHVRRAAIRLASEIPSEEATPELISALIKSLKDPDSLVVEAAASTLAEFPEQSKNSVPLIVAILNESASSRVKASAALALGRIGKDHQGTSPALLAALKHSDERVRWSAAHALGLVGQAKDSSLPALAEALKDPNHIVRRNAAAALGRFELDKETVHALVAALQDEAAEVRAAAAAALSAEKAAIENAVNPLTRILLEDSSNEVRLKALSTLSSYKEQARAAVPSLISALESNPSPDFRRRAASTLGVIGIGEPSVIPTLAKSLNGADPQVREAAALALSKAKDLDMSKDVVSALTERLDKEPEPNVRASIIQSIGMFGVNALDSIPRLTTALDDDAQAGFGEPVYETAALSLGSIAFSLQEEKDLVKYGELSSAVERLEHARDMIAGKGEKLPSEALRNLAVPLNALREELNSRLLFQLAKKSSFLFASHLVFWVCLIFIYPKQPKVQAIFFWNPWVRRIAGFGYVGLALTWLPFLRVKLFSPFKESLLADAELASFSEDSYFTECEVRIPAGRLMPIREAIPKLSGQIILEGDSGLGKSMFLRHLAKDSRRIVVYLPARKCAQGVLEAIQAKLHGVAQDGAFLRSIIYSGGIDVMIDGLNEVSAETRARVVNFVETYFKGNTILTTQPMEWNPPTTARIFVLQPLRPEHIEKFLHSRWGRLSETRLSLGQYIDKCCKYVREAFDDKNAAEELVAIRRILSNPMDLSVVAHMLAQGEQPDLFHLQEQQYQMMAVDFEQKHRTKFPLPSFAEAVHQMRLDDEESIPASEFFDELACMERHRLVLSRQSVDPEGKPVKSWLFRHDKIMEFFIVQTFLGKNNLRPINHLKDSRFRGVYSLLALILPIDAALQLREELIYYAAQSKDHSVSDNFVQLLRARKDHCSVAPSAA